MRRLRGSPLLWAVGLMLLLGLTVAGCKKKKSAPAKPAMQSTVEMNDATAVAQLKSGLYGVEGGSWRWTAQSFTVELMPPASAAANGARLHFKFTLPDAVVDKLGPMQLSASVNSPGAVGLVLDPERYTKAGSYDYTRDVDAGAFKRKGPVTIEFRCDKSIPPTGDDRRELSLIASSVGLEAR